MPRDRATNTILEEMALALRDEADGFVTRATTPLPPVEWSGVDVGAGDDRTVVVTPAPAALLEQALREWNDHVPDCFGGPYCETCRQKNLTLRLAYQVCGPKVLR
jgi:hypothetical protein